MPRYDFLLFDADNTLFDFDRSEHEALRLTLEGIGCRFDAVTENLYLAVNRALWDRLDRGEVDQNFLTVERFALFLRAMGLQGDPAEVNRTFLDHLAHTPILYPGAAALCRRLDGPYRVAIITNGMSVAQRGRLLGSPLAWLDDRLFISQEVGASKPEPAYFQAVFRALGVTDPRRVLVVGDNLRTDVAGGLNAGADALWYNPCHRTGDPAIAPTYEVDSYDALNAILEG